MARLTERVSLMRELACSLQRAQGAMLASDLDQLQQETSQQASLCASLVALGPIPSLTMSDAPTSLRFEIDPPSQALWQELTQVEQTVARLNRVHTALLRRGNAAMAILSRLIGSCENTYSAPGGAEGVNDVQPVWHAMDRSRRPASGPGCDQCHIEQRGER